MGPRLRGGDVWGGVAEMLLPDPPDQVRGRLLCGRGDVGVLPLQRNANIRSSLQLMTPEVLRTFRPTIACQDRKGS